LTAGETSVNFHVVDSARAPWVSSGNSFPSNSGLVLNDGDYAALKEKIISTNIGTYYIFDFDNWKGTGKAIESLKAELNQPNKQNPLGLNESQKMLTVLSRLETYDTLKRAYSMFMFVTTVMGILFFIAAGSVLFFKQYTEIGSAKEKFYKLFKIGITKKEARKILSKELAVTFFAPLIFGSIMGYAFIYFMTHLVGGQDVMTEFMQNATKVVFGYFVFQAGFFLVTRKKYVGEVLEKF
jgi:putative ABC transport system permease protein